MATRSPLRMLAFLLGIGVGTHLSAARKPAWLEVKSPHFVAYTDAGEARAKEVLKEFEGIRSVFQNVFRGIRVDPPKPLIILAARDQDTLKRLLPKEFEGKDPRRSAGYYLGCEDRNYAVVDLDAGHQDDQPYFILFHEYTHVIVHLNFSHLPVWLDEGIADFYGATQIQSERVLLGRVPRGRLQKIRDSVLLPLETLLAVTHDSPHYREGEKTGVFYSQSWALVHYLFMNEQAQKSGLFQAYLKASEDEADPVAAARIAFGDLGKLQGDLGMYVRQARFRYQYTPQSLEWTDKSFQIRPLDDAEALVVQADFLQHNRMEPEARTLLQQAKALAPARPEVQVALAYGLHVRHEWKAAEDAFQEAIRLGSTDFRAPFYLAWIALVGSPGGGSDTSRILGWLEDAVRLRPDFPSTHMLLCMALSRDRSNAEKALAEGKRAVELDPQNFGFRVNLGYACLNLGLGAEARVLGRQLAQLASTPQEKQAAESFLSLAAQVPDRPSPPRPAAAEDTNPAVQPALSPAKADPPKARAITFKLPERLAPLGQEVLQLLAAGQQAEAVQKVKEALVRSKSPQDRKALQGLLDTLEGRTTKSMGR